MQTVLLFPSLIYEALSTLSAHEPCRLGSQSYWAYLHSELPLVSFPLGLNNNYGLASNRLLSKRQWTPDNNVM